MKRLKDLAQQLDAATEAAKTTVKNVEKAKRSTQKALRVVDTSNRRKKKRLVSKDLRKKR